MKNALALLASAAAFAAFAPLAAADATYHTEHLGLSSVGGAALKSGFVQNIKAEGPQVYAHELFVLNGGAANETYKVERHFWELPGCTGWVGVDEVGKVTTNGAGNGRDDFPVPPEAIPSFLADTDHGVFWTFTDADGVLRYETTCTTVHID